MRRQLGFAALGPLLVLFLVPAGRADEITAAMRQADPRLQTRVTLRSPRILVGELLDRLSKQSGVTLIADDWSTAGSDSVAVSLKDVPLSDAMNAVWSLFSYRHSEWNWQRSSVKGTESKFVYTLKRPDYARFLAERLKEQVQMDFEAQAQKMIAALDMPMDQLKEAAKTDKLLETLLTDGRVRPEVRILASLPPETLLNILRNHLFFSVPVSELSPENQRFLHASWDWEADVAAKQGYPKSALLPEGDHISIGVSNMNGIIAPGLFIEIGRGSGDTFGGNYMEADWNRRMNKEWLQPGELADNTVSAHTLSPPKLPPPAGDLPHALADHLLRFADMAQVPLIARIPRNLDAAVSAGSVSQLPKTKTIGTFLEAIQKDSVSLTHKWRGGVLLVACQNWFMLESEDTRIFWTAVRHLRDAEATGDGFLSLNDLAHAAGVLNATQMKALGEWFPVMDNATEWHDFLAFYDKNPDYRPRVLSAKGDASQYPESLVNAKLGIDALRVTYPNLHLQIQQPSGAEDKPPTRNILFVVRDNEGVKPLNGQGFGYVAHEYQSSLNVEEGAAAGGQKIGTALETRR